MLIHWEACGRATKWIALNRTVTTKLDQINTIFLALCKASPKIKCRLLHLKQWSLFLIQLPSKQNQIKLWRYEKSKVLNDRVQHQVFISFKDKFKIKRSNTKLTPLARLFKGLNKQVFSSSKKFLSMMWLFDRIKVATRKKLLLGLKLSVV